MPTNRDDERPSSVSRLRFIGVVASGAALSLMINPLVTKGIGKIGIVSTSATLANAIPHMTGQRLRDLPLRIGSLVSRA